MYEITALNDMLMSELKQVASTLHIEKIDDLSKQDLITNILSAQNEGDAESPKKRKPKAKVEKVDKITQPRRTKAAKPTDEVIPAIEESQEQPSYTEESANRIDEPTVQENKD